MQNNSKNYASSLDSVGDYCSPDFVSIPLNSTVAEAIGIVRRGAKKGNILYVYVTDSDEKLKGVVPIRNLLLATDTEAIASIASANIVFLAESSPMQHAYRVFSQSKFLSLPVVNSSGKIRGVLHAHELIDKDKTNIQELFEERSRGEMFELLGIKGEDQTANVGKVVVGRLPWLALNLVGGSLSACLIHSLGGKLKEAVLFLAFVPLLLVISESLGMQTASMIIAHLNRTTSKMRARYFILKECLIAFLVGVCCAAGLGTAVFLWTRSATLAGTIVLTLLVGSVFVASLASTIPHLFRRLKVDPRVAAGPVVLAIVDPLTLFLFLGFALALS